MNEVDKLSEEFKGKEMTEAQHEIAKVCNSLFDFLVEKNRRYGNSALEPLRIFSQAGTQEGILVRIDDKLSRIKNSGGLRKNDAADLMGYLVLLMVDNGWTDFKDLID